MKRKLFVKGLAASCALAIVVWTVRGAPVVIAQNEPAAATKTQRSSARAKAAMSDDLVLIEVQGTNAKRFSMQPSDPASGYSAQLQLAPGAAVDPVAQIPSEILLFNVIGTNAEKLELSWFKNAAYIITGRYGAGQIRSLNLGVDSQSDLYIDTAHNVIIVNPANGVTLGVGGPKVLSGSADPTLGVKAPLSSMYIRSGSVGWYQKTGTSDTAWTLK